MRADLGARLLHRLLRPGATAVPLRRRGEGGCLGAAAWRGVADLECGEAFPWNSPCVHPERGVGTQRGSWIRVAGVMDGLHVALKWLVWCGSGRGAVVGAAPQRVQLQSTLRAGGWRQGGPLRVSSPVHIRWSLGGKLLPHPSCPQTASPRPPGRTVDVPQKGGGECPSFQAHRVQRLLLWQPDFPAQDRARVPCLGLETSRSVSVFHCFWVPPPQLWFLFASL